MRKSATICAAWTTAALACALIAAPAAAQEARGSVVEAPLPPANADDDANPQPETPLTPEEAAALGNALTFGAADLADAKPAKPLRLPGLASPNKFDVSAKPDGAGTMRYYRPFAGNWDAKIGADLTLAPVQPDGYRPDKPFPIIGGSQDSGAAWASVGMPDIATVYARVDQTSDQSKLGTTFKHSIPIGEQYSLTLQNSYSVTQTIGAPVTTPSAVPLMAAPAGTAAAPAPQLWGSQKIVKFDVLSTGTAFGAGVTTANNDPNPHNTFSTDQTVYGPLHVTAAVNDLGQPSASRSITARFKLSW
jgi:hypothetical protein